MADSQALRTMPLLTPGLQNRLLNLIREQQKQINEYAAAQAQAQGNSGASADDVSAVSDRSSQAASTQSGLPIPGSTSQQPPRNRQPRSSFDMARADLSRLSRTPSQGASPRLRASSVSIGELGEGMTLSGRDESAFYQAETQMLVRENQMLKNRIKALGESSFRCARRSSVTNVCIRETTFRSAGCSC